MKKYCNKIKNKNGASILIALLFFMICAVAASSILMAASSNAGKEQNNRQEYQKYLAVSSAVQYLCDEISCTSYQGKYAFEQTEEGKIFSQLNGEYDSELSKILLSDFDAVFAQEMEDKIKKYQQEDSAVSEFKNTAVFIGNHTFTIKSQTGTDLDKYTVNIDLKIVKESYGIEFTASLDDYMIKVEMTPSSTKPTMPETVPALGENIFTDKMEWKTGWVTNGE